MAPVERHFDTPLGRFAALTWPQPGAPRLLCLHGWLDNAASFVPMGPHLAGLDVVALDLAGHGHSAHRPRGSRYYMTDNLWDVDTVLDALAWPDCNLLGHSLGGAIATTYAATAPQRVERLIALDGLGPLSAGPGETVGRLRRALQSVRKPAGRLREFADPGEAALARSEHSGLPRELAHIIVERALQRHGDGWRWRTDRALNWHSPALLTEAQVIEILEAIEAPVLAVWAEPLARWVTREMVGGRRSVIRKLDARTLSGHHHFHMDQAGTVAQMVRDFILGQGAATR